jgi:hypothetical protein
MEQIKVLVVPAQEAPHVRFIDPTLKNFQAIVGGYIEQVKDGKHEAYVDEDGSMKRLPPNITASILLNRPIVGTAMFFGNDGSDLECSVPFETLVAVATATLASADPIPMAVSMLRAHGYQVTEPRPDAEAKVRRNAPDTSHLVEPRLGSAMERVLRLLRNEQPLTDDDMEQILRLTHQSVSAARRTLVLRGLVVDSGKRGKTRSGNKAILWVTPDRYEELSR